jgi:2-polyprenyl-3-methyl-5-hydroxy-6-metoxy-1,4-benzoquinol methylase
MSISYYDENCDEYCRLTIDANMNALHARFLKHLVPKARILDAGCGSGRDSLAFARAGFSVTAFDGSAKMVRLASENTGLPVAHILFGDVSWDSAFEGVWACASLLHVSRSNLAVITNRLVRSLVPGGVIFMSFKQGESERETEGRHFTDMTEQTIASLLDELGLDVVELWSSQDVRPGRGTEAWVSAIGRRARQ